MLTLALLIAAAPPPPPPAASPPPTAPAEEEADIVFVGMSDKRCIYMTGDVLMGAREFREDLKERFETATPLLIYYAPEALRRCVGTARRIARDLGFRTVRTAPAPPDLDMGPPP